MGIRSFDEFEFYKDKAAGRNYGGFYKLKSSYNQKSSVDLYYIKKINPEEIVNEYISSNIAHLILGNRAPVADLIIFSERELGVVSKVIKDFKTLDDLSDQLKVKQEFIQNGYFVDAENKFQPYHKYLEIDASIRKSLVIKEPLAYVEDVKVVATYLKHSDMHTSNVGAIVTNADMISSIIDFSRSLDYEQNYKIRYRDISYVASHITPYIKKHNVDGFISAIEKLVNQENNIKILLERLFADLRKLGLVSLSSASSITDDLTNKMNAFKEELTWFYAAKAMEMEQNNSAPDELFINIRESNIELVSELVIDTVIDLAVKNDVMSLLIENYPKIINYNNFRKVELSAKIKYNKHIDFDIDLFGVSAVEFLPIAIEYKRHDVFDKLFPLAIVIKFGHIGDALISAVRFNDKESFDRLLPFVHDQLSLIKASNEAVNNDRVDLFDVIYPLLDSSNKGILQIGLINSLRDNKLYFLEKYLPLVSQGGVVDLAKDLVERNQLDILSKVIPYLSEPSVIDTFSYVILNGRVDSFELFVDQLKNTTITTYRKFKFVDFAFREVTKHGSADMLNILFSNGLELSKDNFLSIFTPHNYKLVGAALSQVINALLKQILEPMNELLVYLPFENNKELMDIEDCPGYSKISGENDLM